MISRTYIHNVVDYRLGLTEKGVIKSIVITTKDGHTTEIYLYMEEE